MNESITAENKKQARQKPPLSRRRIAGEILGGVVVGFVAGLVGAFAFLIIPYDTGCFNGVLALAGAAFYVFPAVYGLASGVGVYFVGKTGKQTGSLSLTLGCGFAGWLVIIVIRRIVQSFYWSYWFPDVPDWAFVPFALFAPPLIATLGFNLTRGYKKPPSQ